LECRLSNIYKDRSAKGYINKLATNMGER
jgi:hypothetical protein